MARTVSLHSIEELAQAESKNEILLKTKLNTEIHITAEADSTIISFPFGNKFDIVDGRIVIHEKHR